MTKGSWFGAAMAALAMAGCASEGPGSAGADLAYVDEATIESRGDLFIDPSVSWRPMTEAQLGDVSSAIPVEVDVYGGVAVAWIRTEGTEQLRTRADIVGLFRVVEHATATRDETVRDTDPVYVAPESFAGEVTTDLTQSGIEVDASRAQFALIDWIDLSRIPPQEDAALWRELGENHPGCLAE